MLRCSRRLLSLLAAGAFAAVPAIAHAAELGEARVSSHIGQPLVADIELAMIEDPAQAVAVRLASPEVYNGAGIAMPPVLSGLNLSVMRRDGRQFLHVTSLRPVDSEHLHLYLELADRGQRTVRLATLWLTPDPQPAPAAAPAPLAAPSVAPAPAAALPAPVPARSARSEPAAVPAPAKVPIMPPAPAYVPPAARKVAAAPLPLPARAAQAGQSTPAAPAAPAVCERQAEQARVCAALDGKNAALRQQIGSLEGKVKSLQASFGAAPAAAAHAAPAAAVHAAPAAHAAHVPAPGPAAHAAPVAPVAPDVHAATTAPAAAATAPAAEAIHEPPRPKPISAIKPLVPRKPKAPPEPAPEAGLPWGWIGGGVAVLLLALGGAWLLLRRRARALPKVEIPAGPRLVDRLRASFPARTTAAAPAAPEAVEPGFE